VREGNEILRKSTSSLFFSSSSSTRYATGRVQQTHRETNKSQMNRDKSIEMLVAPSGCLLEHTATHNQGKTKGERQKGRRWASQTGIDVKLGSHTLGQTNGRTDRWTDKRLHHFHVELSHIESGGNMTFTFVTLPGSLPQTGSGQARVRHAPGMRLAWSWSTPMVGRRLESIWSTFTADQKRGRRRVARDKLEPVWCVSCGHGARAGLPRDEHSLGRSG